MTTFIELKDDIDRSIMVNISNITMIASVDAGLSNVWLTDGKVIMVKMPYETLAFKLGIKEYDFTW